MKNFYLRTESIKTEDLKRIYAESDYEKNLVNALMDSEPCLLEGSRGTGKSFLLKIAEEKINSKPEGSNIAVYVSFNISSLISTKDPLQFYHWMLAKTLRKLLSVLRKKGVEFSSEATSLLSNDECESEHEIESSLKEIISQYESSYNSSKLPNTNTLPDIEDVKDAIEAICENNGIERIYFFFDEAAHVFRPEQQRQFFSLYKDLRSPYITCNAAIYPGVTFFGDSFEPLHDCIYKKVERNILDEGYIEHFKTLVLNQSDESLRKTLTEHGELFSLLCLAADGNPRMVLKTIQNLEKINSNNVNAEIKEFYRAKIWNEHTELGEKYPGHKSLIDWGRDFIEKAALSSIVNHNQVRKDRAINQSTVSFWIHKDSPEQVKESLRLLCYTGIIKKASAGVRATRSEIGDRYEIKYGCLISLAQSPSKESIEIYSYIASNKYPEFGKNRYVPA
jgi:hypothetical protein